VFANDAPDPAGDPAALDDGEAAAGEDDDADEDEALDELADEDGDVAAAAGSTTN
jgi:hypothetical protein